MLPALVAIASVLALAALLGALLVGSPARRWATFLLALPVAAAAPWAIPREPVLGRLLVGFSAVTLALRGLDLVRAPTVRDLRGRVAHAISVVDSTLLTRQPPAVAGTTLRRLGAFVALSLPSGYGARSLHGASSVAPWLAQELLAVVFVYALVEVLFASLTVAYGLLGFAVPTLHRDPVRSRTLQEFWGERWNRPIHTSLWRHGFVPLARRGHGLAGIALAFALSGALHGYLAAFAVSLVGALGVGLFFLAQGALVLLERRLGVPRWPPWAQHAWTLATLLGTVPLFLQGVLDALGW